MTSADSRLASPDSNVSPNHSPRVLPAKRNNKAITRDMLIPMRERVVVKGDWAPPLQHWMYSSFEYKMSIKEDQALFQCCRKIDLLKERLSRTESRGHLIFDIVATRKQIERGSPLWLGREIYRFVEEKHFDSISTTFVGLTDNTARRVGRDVYCRCEDLSPKKYDFDVIDNERMFIVYPS